MKLELERQNFLKAWQTAEKISATKTTKESISGILITADENNTVTLTATNLQTSVKCTAEGANVLAPGVALVPAAFLGSMMRKTNAEDLVLDVDEKRGLLIAGSSKTRFAVVPVGEFPNIPESSSAELICEIQSMDLSRLINEGGSAASQPQDFPKYMGTCLLRTEDEYIKIVSTDGKRLASSRCICSVSKADDLLLPAPALKELGKTIAAYSEKNIKIFADDSTAWFTLEGVEFSIRKIDAAFPKYERILNKDVRTTLRASCSELSSVLDRVDIVAKTTPAHIMAIILQPGNGEVRITARAPEVGTANETLYATVEGSNMQIGFNVGYFQDGLKVLAAGDVVIEFSDEEGQARMFKSESDDFLYMLMPARLSSQDAMTEEEIGDFNPDAPEYQEVQQEQQPEQPEAF